jgi:hypothetical protein
MPQADRAGLRRRHVAGQNSGCLRSSDTVHQPREAAWTAAALRGTRRLLLPPSGVTGVGRCELDRRKVAGGSRYRRDKTRWAGLSVFFNLVLFRFYFHKYAPSGFI